MTDGKVQPCRNNCGRNVYVSDRTGKWLPYNEGTDNKHDCPNYKKGSVAAAYIKSDDLSLIKEIQNFDIKITHIEESVNRIEELLEATLKNLGLFTTAGEDKRLPPVNRTLGGDPLD